MTGEREARPPLGRWLDRALSIGAFGVCLASVLPLFADVSWLLALAAHFRVQYLVVSIALIAALALRRRRLVGLALVPFAIANAVVLTPYLPHRPLPAPPGAPVSVMTSNVNGSNRDYARFIALVRNERPDVIVVQEIDTAWAAALDALSDDYAHSFLLPRDDLFGIGVLSRLPLIARPGIDLDGAPAVDARIRLGDGRELRLIGVHLWPPTSAALAAARDGQLESLLAHLQTDIEPTVVIGDFNITPYSAVMRRWLARSRLVDPRRGAGFTITWPAFLPIAGIPIDHCLVSEHFIVAEQHVGPAFGSDHYPVITRLLLRGNE